MSAVGLAPRMPLRIGSKADYAMVLNYADLVKQNFKNLVLTNPGERIMDIEFGVGLRRFLFEMNGQSTYDEISARISQQVALYMPFLNVRSVQFGATDEGIDNSQVTIAIAYEIVPLNVQDVLSLDSITTAATFF
jgi:phage baseplate assembly protein W